MDAKLLNCHKKMKVRGKSVSLALFHFRLAPATLAAGHARKVLLKLLQPHAQEYANFFHLIEFWKDLTSTYVKRMGQVQIHAFGWMGN